MYNNSKFKLSLSNDITNHNNLSQSLTTLLPDNTSLIPKGIVSSSFVNAWKDGYTGKNVKVAIVDTGIQPHNDLKDTIVDSIKLTTNDKVINGHGTRVAGIIAANGLIKGGAYDCKLIDVKVMDNDTANIDAVANGITLACNKGVNIINLSLGGINMPNHFVKRLSNVIEYAWNKGVVCVAASGNQGIDVNTPDVYNYPASILKVESVSACDIDQDNNINLAYFSNENDRVDIAACGVNVLTTDIEQNYVLCSGTSMAAPHVTAMLAILLQYILENYPELKGPKLCCSLISLLHKHMFKISNANYNIKANNCLRNCTTLNAQYTNISFKLNYLRYNWETEPIIPTSEKIYLKQEFIGYLLDI